jgi:hypothetical protein
MLLLAATTDKLGLITTTTADIHVHISYIDRNSSTLAASGGGKQNTAITSVVASPGTDILAVPGASTLRNIETINIRNAHASSSNTVTVIFNQNATIFELFKATLAAGEVLSYVEGIGWFINGAVPSGPILFKSLAADDTGGQLVATAQPWFPTAGGVTVQAATTYQFEGQLMLATGATTHTTGTLFAGTATLTSIDYHARIFSTANLTIGTTISYIRVSVATVIVLNATSTAVETVIQMRGVVKINGAGTFIPQFQFSANPTTPCTTRRGSYFAMQAMAADTQGTWA